MVVALGPWTATGETKGEHRTLINREQAFNIEVKTRTPHIVRPDMSCKRLTLLRQADAYAVELGRGGIGVLEGHDGIIAGEGDLSGDGHPLTGQV